VARGIWLRRLFQALVFGLVLFGAGAHVHASVALLMEEPYGEFGAGILPVMLPCI